MEELTYYKNDFINNESLNKMLIDKSMNIVIRHIIDTNVIDFLDADSIAHNVKLNGDAYRLQDDIIEVVVRVTNTSNEKRAEYNIQYNNNDIIMLLMDNIDYINREIGLD